MKGTPEQPMCGFSRATIQILGLQGVDPKKLSAFNVLEDQELREGIKEFSEWPTIPQLYVNKEFVGGCDILVGMHQSGELEDLLEKADVLSPPVSETADKWWHNHDDDDKDSTVWENNYRLARWSLCRHFIAVCVLAGPM